jgi:hypothetical protein
MAEQILWNEAGKGHNNIGLDPAMLLDQGLILHRFACKTGENKTHNREIRIKYNRYFVVYRIIRLASVLMSSMTIEDWIKLCEESYIVYQDELDETNTPS